MSHASIQEIVCLLGQPVAGNPMQYVMEKAFAKAGLDWRYLTLEVAGVDLSDAVRGLRAMGMRGANLTSPHQMAVLPYLDRLSAAATRMGVVNCVRREGQDLIGENTDGQGFLAALGAVTKPAGKTCVLLGAGAMARAIAVELAQAGVSKITIVNRSPERGTALTSLLNDKLKVVSELIPWEGEFAIPAGTDILVHAARVGLHEGVPRAAVDPRTLAPEMVVAEVALHPPFTRLLKEARGRGCATVDGLEILVNQVVLSFRLWTEMEPDRELIRDSVEEFLGF